MLIGSKAAKHWFPDFREPKDTDIMSIAPIQGAETKWCNAFEILVNKYNCEIAPPSLLYTIKLSHFFWDGPNWDKTAWDICFFQSKKVKYIQEDFELLYKQWEIIHGKKRAYLDKSNDDFFKDGVNRVFVHDSIHEAMAFYELPLYTKLKHNKDKAVIAKDLFDALSYEDKVKLVKEEAFVTALERFVIPNDYNYHPVLAYHKALKLLLVSMTKGFFAEFIAKNWLDIRQIQGYDYVGKFRNAVSLGKVEKI